MTPAEVLQKIEELQIRFVDLQFTDIAGAVKSITVPAREFSAALDHGIWFDGSSVEGFARIAESDMYLTPDPTTFAVVPWMEGSSASARVICNVFNPNGTSFMGDPRAVLSRVLEEAAQMGFVYNTGPELEFFLIKPHPNGELIPPIPADKAGYFDLPTDLFAGLRHQITTSLESFGIMVEAMHAEVAQGQHEIDFRYSEALRTADNAITFRIVVKTIAQQHGLHATFIPKLRRGMAGNGMHVHQSLLYKQTGVNAFSDPGDLYGLSQTARQFMAGQLYHARAMSAVLAPLVNSYKRLVAGYEAPVYISWGRINRSALLRVPRAHLPESTRVELRCPDPSCNPYLAFAVMLAAGLDGIRQGMTLQPASEENLYLVENPRETGLKILPTSLGEAIDEFEKSALMRSALGPHIFERLIKARRQEWEDYNLEVNDWELRRYLATF